MCGYGGNCMNRDTAFKELCVRLTSEKRKQHSVAVEAIMKRLASYFQQEIDLWGLVGLLHDIDLEIVDGDLNKHGLVAEQILEGLNVDTAVIYAIKAHNPVLGFERRRKIDKALYCSDHLPNFIAKCALSIPSENISDLNKDYLLEKFDEEGFINNMHKEQISTCSILGISLEDFFDIGLSAMSEINYII